MNIKTTQLTGPALDWAVELAKGTHWSDNGYFIFASSTPGNARYDKNPEYSYSSVWSAGGPIIEHGRIKIFPNMGGTWSAQIRHEESHPLVNHKVLAGFTNSAGPTPLIAAMRCFVASKLGLEINIPDSISLV